MEKQNFTDQPLKYQIEALKVVEQDYITRSKLNAICSKVTVDVAGDDVGLIMRQSLNESSRGDFTRAKDLSLLKRRIEDLEVELEKQKKIEKVQEHCEALISAAKRVLEHPKEWIRGDSDAADPKVVEHEALRKQISAVWEIYEGVGIKKVEPVKDKGGKRRRIQK